MSDNRTLCLFNMLKSCLLRQVRLYKAILRKVREDGEYAEAVREGRRCPDRWGYETRRQKERRIKQRLSDKILNMPAEVFTGKVQVELYNILPLDDVITDYDGKILNMGDTVRFRPATGRPFSFIIDKRMISPVHSMAEVEATASGISYEITKKESYKWKAFAVQMFYWPEGYLDVLYGVLEDKT